jgi:hypothetical protein
VPRRNAAPAYTGTNLNPRLVVWQPSVVCCTYLKVLEFGVLGLACVGIVATSTVIFLGWRHGLSQFASLEVIAAERERRRDTFRIAGQFMLFCGGLVAMLLVVHLIRLADLRQHVQNLAGVQKTLSEFNGSEGIPKVRALFTQIRLGLAHKNDVAVEQGLNTGPPETDRLLAMLNQANLDITEVMTHLKRMDAVDQSLEPHRAK